MQMLGEIVGDHVARNGPISEDVKQRVDEEWRAAFGGLSGEIACTDVAFGIDPDIQQMFYGDAAS